jgi:mono/diheme cytochrome c family protein
MCPSVTRRLFAAASIGVTLLAAACNSLDEPTPAGAEGIRVSIPVDVRSTAQALHVPPAIPGGTLAVSVDGLFAVAADPDRDRVSVVDLTTDRVQQITLEAGSEPGRVVIDPAGFAYVALRRAGDVLQIELASGTQLQRTHVCAAPRGLALEPATASLHVACAEGRLITLSAGADVALERTRELQLEPDLRDVLVRDGELFVSTFKRATFLRVSTAGEVSAAAGPKGFTLTSFDSRPNRDGTPNGGARLTNMVPRVAWRTAQSAEGVLFMLHQSATTDEVAIDEASTAPSANASPYGGGGFDQCAGIVTPAFTWVDRGGNARTAAMPSGVLSVDLAASIGGNLAIVQAGSADPGAPRPSTLFDESDNGSAPISLPPGLSGAFPVQTQELPADIDPLTVGSSRVTLFNPAQLLAVSGADNCGRGTTINAPGQATAVAFVTDASVMVQSREPALLSIMSATGARSKVISLGGESVRDTGHEIFHRDAGGGIACASCHAEGLEDGHTWRFNTVGMRRTQSLAIGLEGTAPFHWNGEEANIDHLMEDVFVGRMGGVHQNPPRLSALTRFLFSLQPPAAGTATDDPAAVRGKTLFERDAGCASCHSGAKLTNNLSVDVGTGGKLQVPSLRGVSYRAPFMHNGCAATLRDRFDPACGGSAHGNTRQLSASQVDDVVSYLQTL